MLTEKELRGTIEECKAAKPTVERCSLMSSCYIILDHLFPEENRTVTAPAEKSLQTVTDNGSDFIRAARYAGIDRTLEVLNEHMACVRTVYPKEYAAIMRMLRE